MQALIVNHRFFGKMLPLKESPPKKINSVLIWKMAKTFQPISGGKWRGETAGGKRGGKTAGGKMAVRAFNYYLVYNMTTT